MKQYLQYLWSNKNYRLSMYLSGVTLLWLFSGSFFGSAEEPAPAAVSVKQEVLVKARYMIAQDYAAVTHIRSRTEANRKVSLMAEVEGRVVSLPAAEGRLVKKGDVVCELALEDRQLRFKQAQSAVAQAQLEYDGSLKLKSGGYQSRTAIAAAKAKLDSNSKRLQDLKSLRRADNLTKFDAKKRLQGDIAYLRGWVDEMSKELQCTKRDIKKALL
jgi:multidrug efflux system membrane fusion protein